VTLALRPTSVTAAQRAGSTSQQIAADLLPEAADSGLAGAGLGL
jgi:hypothetical protein